MRADFKDLTGLVVRAQRVHGDFAEIGVWKGDSLVPLAQCAAEVGKRCLAFDSFEGMAEPDPVLDREEDGSVRYPKGAFSLGGADGVTQLRANLLAALGEKANHIIIHRGWVPQVLNLERSASLALAIIDLDHYLPTAQALGWAWNRLSFGGVLICHDWIPGRKKLAAFAFEEFCSAHSVKPHGPTPTRYGWIVKETL